VADLRFTIFHVLLDNVGWTPVPAPEFGVSAEFWSVNGYDMLESSSSVGAAGETRTISAGELARVEVPQPPGYSNRSGIAGGLPITYLKSTQPADEVIVRFFRW
jgi:hypothetical protein